MSLREEELVLLFDYIDARIGEICVRSIENKCATTDPRVDKLRQDCIDVIAFGEKIEGTTV